MKRLAPLAQRRRVRCVWQVGRLKSRELTLPRPRGRGPSPGLAGAGSQEAHPATPPTSALDQQQQSLFIETYPNMDVIRTPNYNKLTYGHASYMPMVERGSRSAMVVEVIRVQPPPTRRPGGEGYAPSVSARRFFTRPVPAPPPPSGTHSTGEGGRGAYPRDHRPFITNYMSRGGTAAQRGC